MTSTATAATDTASGLLAAARGCRERADRAEAELLQTAARWAGLHVAEHLDDAECYGRPDVFGKGRGVPIAAPGAPLVTEYAAAEFAAAVGLGPEPGKRYVGHAVELAHRLPTLWRRVVAGEVAAWRARRVAEQTIGRGLTGEAAGFVDRHVAPVAGRIGSSQVDRLVVEAIGRFMPETAEATRRQAADGRHLDIDHHQISFAGSRRGVSSRTPRSAAKVEERRPRPERSEGLGNASRNPVRCLAPRPNVARYLGHGEVSAAGSNHLGQSSGDHSA